MKYYFLTILLTCTYWILSAQQCQNTDRYFVHVGNSLFDWNATHSIGLGKYILESYSAFSLEYEFRKECYTIIPFSYSKAHTMKLSYLYSLQFCDPLYLNVGLSVFAGKEKASVPHSQKTPIVGGQLISQAEARCFNWMSIIIEPVLSYQFKTLLKEHFNVGIKGGVKIYFH